MPAMPRTAIDAAPRDRRWPAALTRALERCRPMFGDDWDETAAALSSALAGVRSSIWPDVAWRFSALTGDGFPVELTFSSRAPGLRYTAEAAGPEVGHAARIDRAVRWAYGSAGWSAAPDLHDVETPARARWGAWIGGSHAPGAPATRKLYLEARGTAPALGEAAVQALPAGSQLRLVGAAGPLRESYFRRDRLRAAEIGRLLRALDRREAFAPLCASIAGTLPWPSREELVPVDAGFSVSTAGAFSVFTYARRLWGADGAIRRRLLDLANRHGWDFSTYARVTAPLETAEDYLTAHGVLAWVAAPGRDVELRVSVRPPLEVA
jgi:hypothetical protein